MRTPKNNEFPEESSYYPSQPEPVAFNPAENLGPASNALPPQSLKPAPVVDAKPAFTGELPANCPRCGAPLKSDDIKWNGKQAACSYEIIPARVGLRLEYNNFQKITTARIFYGTDPLTSHG
jgi:hypothetical protein